MHHMYTVGLDKIILEFFILFIIYIFINFIFKTYDKIELSYKGNILIYNSSPKELEIIFGSLLGNGQLELPPKNKNVRFGIIEKEKNKDYFKYIYNEIKVFGKINKYREYINLDKKTKKYYKSLNFWTKSLPILNNLYKDFYINNIKVIPNNLELLTPLALAHWIMQNGYNEKSKGLYIYTDNFTYNEVKKLSNYLKLTYNIKSSIHKINNNYRIYILVKSIDILKKLILPYMHKSMYYKLRI